MIDRLNLLSPAAPGWRSVLEYSRFKYAQLIVHYYQAAKAGGPPEIVGIQNEGKPPDAEWPPRILRHPPRARCGGLRRR